MTLRLSHYVFEVAVDSGLMLYSARTGSVIHLDSDQSKQYTDLTKSADLPAGHPLVRSLAEEGLVVEDTVDEVALIRSWFELYSRNPNMVHLTLLPAEACNFSCPYCFQYRHRSLMMKAEVYDGVFLFVKHLIEKRGSLNLELSWFGGEPTLATDCIIGFMERLNSLSNLCTRAAMVTNGYLLTRETLARLVQSKVTEFQITLDGNRDSHDTLRALKNGEPTFDTIYNNLLSSRDLPMSFELVVRANFLKSNFNLMKGLVKQFASDFGGDSRYRLYFRPVYHFQTTRDDPEVLRGDICTLSQGLSFQEELTRETVRILGQAPYGRMVDPLPRPTPSWCPAQREQSYIVGADGLLFACDTLVGEPLKSIGSISEDGSLRLLPGALGWRQSVFDEADSTCLGCRLLPVCMGGCKRARLEGVRPCYWTEERIIEALKCYTRLAEAV